MGNKITRRCTSVVDERYTRPQGLYPQRDVDQKKLRRLILDSKLAPCFPGEDEPNADFEECPICFLCYPSLNRSKCCSKGVCTECYLQMKTPRPARAAQCPFCKSHNYTVEFRGVKSQEEKRIEAAEEQKVLEAKIRMRKQELLDDELREQRQKKNNTNSINNNTREALDIDTAQAVVDELGISSPAVELPESLSSNVQLVETPQQESEATSDRSSSCDDLEESSRIHEESGSDETILVAPTTIPAPEQQSVAAAAALSLVCQPMEPATSQQQLRPALPGYLRHRDEEFDFDLEDIMVMEAIWQSIQEQGTCYSYARSELIQPPSTHLANSAPDSTAASESQTRSSPATASQPQEQQQQHSRGPSGRMTGGLATAIAALAERYAIKAEPAAAAAFKESLRIRANQQSNEVGTSSSCANLNLNAPTKTTTASGGEVMLPQSFEEQMMLAMALSITDAQSRARLEDSNHNSRPWLA